MLAAISSSQATIPLADRCRDMRNLIARGFTRMCRAAKCVERLREEGPNEKRLEPARFGLLHFLLNGKQPLGTHGFLGERIAVEKVFQVVAIKRLVDFLREARTHLRLIAVTDGLDQKVLEAGFFEDLAENV